MENDFVEKRNKKSFFWLGAVVLVIALLVGVAFYVYTKTTSGSNVFKSTINELFEGIMKNPTGKKSTSMNLSFNIATNNKDAYQDAIDIINKMNIKTDLQIDYDNFDINEKLIINYDNKSLLDTNLYLKDQNLYILLNNVFDKYIKINIGEQEEISELKNNINIILESLKKAFVNSLKDEYFNVETENDLKKTTLVMNEKVLYEISISVLTNLSKDNKFIDTISKLTEGSVDEIKNSIKNSIETIKEDKELSSDSTDEATISIYTNGSRVVKILIDSPNNKLNIYQNNNNYYIEYKEDNKVIFTIDVKVDNDNYTIIYNDTNSDVRLTINASVTTKEINKIDDADVTNNVLYEELTEEDKNAILDKLSKNETILKLMKILSE